MELDLLPGERVLWTGAPAHPPTPSHYRDVAPVMVLGLVSYAVLFYSTTLLGPGFFSLETMGWLTLVNIGLFVVLLRPLWQARRATYAVTNLRLVVRIGEVGRSVRLGSLGPPVVSARRSGIGTVWFGGVSMTGRVRALFDLAAPPVVLREVVGAGQVAAMIREAQRTAEDGV